MPAPTVPAASIRELIEAHPEDSNYALAQRLAQSFGVSHRAMMTRIAKLRHSEGVPKPDGHTVSRVTALYGPDGETKLRWVRSEPEKEAFFQVAGEYIAALCEKVPRQAPRKRRTRAALDEDLLNAIVIGDAHFGMLAWRAETGADFDLKIAESDLRAGVDRLLESLPGAGTCLIANMGDYFHVDNNSPLTPASHNVLDTDSRYTKMLRVGIKTMRYLIERALDSHEKVVIRNVAGNHDPHSSITLALALDALYEREPRVVVETSPRAFWWFRHGKNLVGLTHGHQIRKPEDMAMQLAVQAQDAWSGCPYRYVWQGHIHHIRAKEHGGVIVEAFRTLAGPDAWHAAQGYTSGREVKAIVLHKEFGEVERHTASLARARAG